MRAYLEGDGGGRQGSHAPSGHTLTTEKQFTGCHTGDLHLYTGWPKMAPFLYALLYQLSLKIQPHLKCVATLPCEMSSAECLKSNNWKQDDFCNNTSRKNTLSFSFDGVTRGGPPPPLPYSDATDYWYV